MISVLVYAALAIVGVDVALHFGALDGLAVAAALWLLMPYQPERR